MGGWVQVRGSKGSEPIFSLSQVKTVRIPRGIGPPPPNKPWCHPCNSKPLSERVEWYTYMPTQLPLCNATKLNRYNMKKCLLTCNLLPRLSYRELRLIAGPPINRKLTSSHLSSTESTSILKLQMISICNRYQCYIQSWGPNDVHMNMYFSKCTQIYIQSKLL